MLATENVKAPETIKTLIAEMQHMTKDSVAASNEISGTIGRSSEIAPTITAAVNAQGAPTQEIAHNIAGTTYGAAQVAVNSTDVSHRPIRPARHP